MRIMHPRNKHAAPMELRIGENWRYYVAKGVDFTRTSFMILDHHIYNVGHFIT